MRNVAFALGGEAHESAEELQNEPHRKAATTFQGSDVVSNGRGGGTRAFALRTRTPPSQARSGENLKTCHWHVFLTVFHLSGSSPTVDLRRRFRVLMLLVMVGAVGLEPTSLAAADFKSAAYANSATPPNGCFAPVRKSTLDMIPENGPKPVLAQTNHMRL